MRIGNLELASNLWLAPIAGYCDPGFRMAVRSLGGLGLACTALISARGLVEESRNTARLLLTCPEDQPLCVQLYGADAGVMSEAARLAADCGAAVIDINMGCPVEKVTRVNGGAALLCDPNRAVGLAGAVVRAVTVPVTVKLRLGPDDEHIVAPELAGRLREVGVAAVIVHGRTTAQCFRGKANLDGIAEVVSAAGELPVIGNGDVRRPPDAAAMLERTGCVGVMIGRGALRDPWIFRDTDSLLRTGCIPPPPSIAERVELMVRHFDYIASVENERRTCHIIRQRISWYTKMLGPCRPFKERVHTVVSLADFRSYVEAFLADVNSRGD